MIEAAGCRKGKVTVACSEVFCTGSAVKVFMQKTFQSWGKDKEDRQPENIARRGMLRQEGCTRNHLEQIVSVPVAHPTTSPRANLDYFGLEAGKLAPLMFSLA